MIAASSVGRISFHGGPSSTSPSAAWRFLVTVWLKTADSAITQSAICDRTNTALSGGISPLNSRASAEPRNAMAAAVGVGNSSAADSSNGKLRLNPIETFVGTGRSSATITAAAHANTYQSVNICGSVQTDQIR